jgi:predicted acetyltransferase
LSDWVGHIGYVVLPEFRRQRCYYDPPLAIQIAREKLGIGRILVTCDDDNMASIRTIEKNGGILENVVNERDCDKRKRRYWVEAQ